MSDQKEYRIEHITDLALIPIEHMEEAIADLGKAILQLHMFSMVHETPVDLRAACPFIRFIPDGKGTSTATLTDASGHVSQFIIEPEAPPPTSTEGMR